MDGNEPHEWGLADGFTESDCIAKGACAVPDAQIFSTESSCTSHYACVGGTGSGSESDCTGGGGTWSAGVWTPATFTALTYVDGTWDDVADLDEDACTALGDGWKCMECSEDISIFNSVEGCDQYGVCGCDSVDDTTNTASECTTKGTEINDDSCTWTAYTTQVAADLTGVTTEREYELKGANCFKCSDPTKGNWECSSSGSCSGPLGCSESYCCNNCCSEGTSVDQSSCEGDGFNWLEAEWVSNTVIEVEGTFADDDACEDSAPDGETYWLRKTKYTIGINMWDVGTMVAGPPMIGYDADGTCTGNAEVGESAPNATST